MADSKSFRADREVQGILRVWDNYQAGHTAATGTTRVFEAIGTESNIGFTFQVKGTGVLKVPVGYSANISSNEDITNKQYVDTRIVGKQILAPLDAPGAGQDGYGIIWDNSENKFTLGPVSGATYSFASGVQDVGAGVVKLGGTLDRDTLITTSSNHPFSLVSPTGATGYLDFQSSQTNRLARILVDGGAQSITFLVQGDGVTTTMNSSLVMAFNNTILSYSTASTTRALTLSATDAVFSDNINNRGLRYSADFSAQGVSLSGNRWIPDIGYTNSKIGGKNISALISNPTVTQNNYFIAWDQAGSQYTLLPVSAPTGYTTLQDADNNPLTQRGILKFGSGLTATDDGANSRTVAIWGGNISQNTIIGGQDTHNITFNATPNFEFALTAGHRIYGDTFGWHVQLSSNRTFSYVADYSSNFTDRSLIDKGYFINEITPDWIAAPSTTFSLNGVTHNRQIIICTNAGTHTITIPTGLPLGFQVVVYRAAGAGPVNFVSAGTLDTALSPAQISTEKTAVYINHRGSNIHTILGGGAGGGGGAGTITSIGLDNITGFATAFGSPTNPLTSGAGALGYTLNSQTANTFLAAPDGTDGVPVNRTIVWPDIPNYEWIPTNGTGTFNTTLAHNKKIINVTDVVSTNINLISSPPVGWTITVYRSVGSGLTTLVPPGGGSIEGLGSIIALARTAVTVIHKGSNVFVVLGAVGNFSFGTTTQIPFMNATNDNFSYSSNFVYDGTNHRLGIGVTPTSKLHIRGTANNQELFLVQEDSGATNLFRIWEFSGSSAAVFDLPGGAAAFQVLLGGASHFQINAGTNILIQKTAQFSNTNSTTQAPIRITGVTSDPSSLTNGDIWHVTSTINKLRTRLNGITNQFVTTTVPGAGQDAQSLRWNNSSNLWEYYTPSSGGGITNAAANNELAKSDGTNLIASGIFSTAAGNLHLGINSTTAGAVREISAQGSAANIELQIRSKGNEQVVLITDTVTFTNQAGTNRLDLDFTLGRFQQITNQTLELRGYANPSGNGGNTIFRAGSSSGSNGNGGNVTLHSGSPNGSGTPGSIYLRSLSDIMYFGDAADPGTTRRFIPEGSEANITLELYPKVSGNVILGTDSTGVVQIGRSTSGGNRKVTVGSSSTNATMIFESKGSSGFEFQPSAAPGTHTLDITFDTVSGGTKIGAIPYLDIAAGSGIVIRFHPDGSVTFLNVPTSNPGAGKLWSNSNVLTLGT